MNELNKRKYRTVLLGLALLLTLLLLSGAWVLHSSYNALITTPEPAAPEAEAPVSFTPEPVLPIREAEEEPSEGPTEEISFPGIYHILLLGVDSCGSGFPALSRVRGCWRR